jgi:predicted small metal-binding protein
MAKVVNCSCGEKMTADTDDELVRLVQAHGKEVHQQEVSAEDAMAMAQPVE